MQIFLISYGDSDSDKIIYVDLRAAEKAEDLHSRYDPSIYDIDVVEGVQAFNSAADYEVVLMTSEEREAFDIVRNIKVPPPIAE